MITLPAGPSGIRTTDVTEWVGGSVRRVQDDLVSEEPLEIRVGGVPVSVTMRTPGHDLELAAGFLFTEGVIRGREEIVAIEHLRGPDERTLGNVVQVTPAVPLDVARLRRHFFATSSCGICGRAALESVRVRGIERPDGSLTITADLLCGLPDIVRRSQSLFSRTGGLHAAGLFDRRGHLVVLREDVGRHNAVDKIVGHGLLDGRLPLSDHLLVVSGRGGFEIIQKALVAGLPLVASVSAPSSLAVQLAREFGLTLVGFLRGRRFVVYSGDARLSHPDQPRTIGEAAVDGSSGA